MYVDGLLAENHGDPRHCCLGPRIWPKCPTPRNPLHPPRRAPSTSSTSHIIRLPAPTRLCRQPARSSLTSTYGLATSTICSTPILSTPPSLSTPPAVSKPSGRSFSSPSSEGTLCGNAGSPWPAHSRWPAHDRACHLHALRPLLPHQQHGLHRPGEPALPCRDPQAWRPDRHRHLQVVARQRLGRDRSHRHPRRHQFRQSAGQPAHRPQHGPRSGTRLPPR